MQNALKAALAVFVAGFDHRGFRAFLVGGIAHLACVAAGFAFTGIVGAGLQRAFGLALFAAVGAGAGAAAVVGLKRVAGFACVWILFATQLLFATHACAVVVAIRIAIKVRYTTVTTAFLQARRPRYGAVCPRLRG